MNNWIYAACLIVVGAIILVADHCYPILRDLPTNSKVNRRNLPYSLGRVQMALWTTVLVGSIVYVRFFTGTGDGVWANWDSSLYALIGVSGATGVVSAAIDATKDSQVANAKAEIAGAAQSLAAADTQFAAAQMVQNKAPNIATGTMITKLIANRADTLNGLAAQGAIVKRQHRTNDRHGILTDLLTDENGNSLHRLQLMFFTVLLAADFVAHVAFASTNPDLKVGISNQVLGLLGISGGIYAGFKIPGRAG